MPIAFRLADSRGDTHIDAHRQSGDYENYKSSICSAIIIDIIRDLQQQTI
jgi:hypothetical protein